MSKTTRLSEARMSRNIFDDGAFRVKATPSGATKYDIFLFGAIEEASQFTEAIVALNEASDNDFVEVHLSTDGGSVDATDTFITAMLNSSARVVVTASGGVHSAGTIILLAAPEFRLSPGFNCLIHNGAMGGYSKTSDIKAQMSFSAKMMDRLAHDTYEGFMTEEEIEQMIAGKDFWMDAEEFMRRIKIREVLEGNDEGPSEVVDSTE